MDDLISRQAAIEAIRASESKYTGFMGMELYTTDDAVEAIKGVPSAQSERPKGEWKKEWNCVFHVDLPICSYCLEFSPFKYDFCPRCGADMREVAKVNDRN